MKERTIEPTEQHIAFRDEIVAIVKAYADDMSGEEVLAVLSYIVGQALAMQDQRTMTIERASQIIRKNIELGNQHVISQLEKTEGSA